MRFLNPAMRKSVMNRSSKQRLRARSTAFTIIEVLIALTASLLLMLGLTRAFKLIGDRITSSQSELEMASSLREVTFRMRDELRRMTPTMTAPQKLGSNAGYFTYYEGPWSDATTTMIHGQDTTSAATNYFPTSRFGDLDDYLAFTTRSDAGRPFAGVVPSGVIEAIRLSNWLQQGLAVAGFRTLGGSKVAGAAGVPLYTIDDAHQPQVIYSELAEVVYFVSPQWTQDALGVPVAASPTASAIPVFRDVVNETGGTATGDGIPDRLTLHRRTLLVRNDLNLSVGQMNILNAAVGGSAVTQSGFAAQNEGAEPQLPFLRGAGSGTEVVRLIDERRYSPGVWDLGTSPQIADSPNWLSGMARPSQWMDLSISRVVQPANGQPLEAVRANGMDDLSVPHNRFAFTRMPIGVFSSGSASSPFATGLATTPPTSSMPLLALSPPHTLLAANAASDVVNTGTVNLAAMGGQSAGAAAFSPFSMVGFMRPEFSLADYYYDRLPQVGESDHPMGIPVASPTLRGGSDIIAEDVLAFDVQVFDPAAPLAIWLGPDGVPGSAGDDDGDGTPNNESELGFANSDDTIVDASSYGFRNALTRFDTTMAASPDFSIRARGGFVDYGYARTAGGTIGGMNTTRVPSYTTSGPVYALRPLFVTPFSGIESSTGTVPFPAGWINSGRVLMSDGPINSFYQPMIDTWTDFYNRDPFFQGNSTAINAAFIGNPTTLISTRCYTTGSASSTGSGFVTGGSVAASESAPPTTIMPTALKITIRIYDPKAGEVRQQTVIEHFTSGQ